MTRSIHPTRCPRRRGTAYVAILGLAMLMIAVAIGASLAVRSQRLSTRLRNDESEARTAGYAGIDWAWYTFLADSSWRSTTPDNTYSTDYPFGRGTVAFKVVDESDGALAGNPLQPVRLYSMGRVDDAARGFSVVLKPTGPTLDALALPLYSDTASVSGTVYASGGPLVCANLFTVNALATLNGDLECGSILKLGVVTGTAKTGVAPRTLPHAANFDNYAARATPISFSALSAGNLTGKLLTATSNPYGVANAEGIYAISVPSASTLTITNCRIQGTLVVTLATASRLTLSGANLWEPPADGMPTLLVKSSALTATVTFNGSLTPLSEATAGTNFNPTTSPYGSSSDNDLLDTYPAKIHGLIHIMGSGVSTNFSSNVLFKGCCICEGAVALSGGASLVADPHLTVKPPDGYINPTGLAAVADSWRREPDE